MIETMHASGGGPWSGPSFGNVKSHQPYCDGSDSESENMDSNHHCWTRVGGPLMRTASASLFVQEHGDHILHINKDDLTDEAEADGVLGHKELSDDRQINKVLNETPGCLNTRPIVKKANDGDTEDNECCINASGADSELALDTSSVWSGQPGHYLVQPNNQAGENYFLKNPLSAFAAI
jgi:hypothetical protein